ncbi:glycosyltransferase family 39 protein [Streptomyces sp. ISL-1]|uniref:glycosyltransferase family 39 protein n=1 Tax=Streptomyces sp. ISL-1 TaxID=2817657 RepID=UPI001BE9DAE6|nr:glycosyltransferase family 39 protein [Streptomyces sp. ISL-1]MBT2392794.1 glycosyltransferase family 39 protein [Streptomyces sp. ISL-1]
MALFSPSQTQDRTPPAEGADVVQAPEAQRAVRGVLRSTWLWPALATLLVTVYEIGRPQMWEDELISWDVASRSTEQLFAVVRQVDGVLGTYYLFLHGWMAVFGESATAVRMPSALAMAGTAACVALIGQRLFGRRAGLVGGLVFALIPVVTRYAHEARPYALVVLAVALATLLLLRALDNPKSWWRWTGYALCVGAIGLLHVVALTALAGHLVAVLLRLRSEHLAARRFCLAAMTGVACASPVVLLGKEQATRQLSWIPKPDVWALVTFLPQLYASALAAGAVTVLAVMAWRGRRDAVLFIIALAALPPLAVWALSHGEVSYFFYRYLLFTLPAWAVLAGAGLTAVRSRAAVAGALVVLAVLTLPDQQGMRKPYGHFWDGLDYAGAARTIQQAHRPGDAVVYDRGDDAGRRLDVGVRFYLPRDLQLRDVFLSASAAERNDLWSAECPDPAACLRGERRIWLVVAGNGPNPLRWGLSRDQAEALSARYTVRETEHLTGLTVTLLQRNP